MFLLLLFFLGAAVGSFLGAYTYRTPRGKSIKSGRSFCPKCKAKIVWYDNIPIISYIVLKGSCRRCRKPISIRYLLIELATASLFVTFAYLSINCENIVGTSALRASPVCNLVNYLGSLTLPYLLGVIIVVVAIFVIDLENKIIPDELVFLLFAVSSLTVFLFPTHKPYLQMFSGFGVALFFLALHLATKGRGMGLGDVKLVLFGGVALGWPELVSWMFLSFVGGSALGLVLIALGKASFGKQIPFGPFLIVSFIITLIFGDFLQIGCLLR